MSAAECMVVTSCSAADLMTSMHEMVYIICKLACVTRVLYCGQGKPQGETQKFLPLNSRAKAFMSCHMKGCLGGKLR